MMVGCVEWISIRTACVAPPGSLRATTYRIKCSKFHFGGVESDENAKESLITFNDHWNVFFRTSPKQSTVHETLRHLQCFVGCHHQNRLTYILLFLSNFHSLYDRRVTQCRAFLNKVFAWT